MTSTCTTTRNLGVIFDTTISLEPHIASIFKEAFCHLRCISSEATKTLVQSLIYSRLDYCNSTLGGFPVVNLQKLLCVQNGAAQLTTKCKKKPDRITPYLMDLHWLPVHSQIIYKILVLTYRALNGEALNYIKSLLNLYMFLLGC